MQVDHINDVETLMCMVDDPILGSVLNRINHSTDILMLNTTKNIIVEGHFKGADESGAELLKED